MLNPSCLPVAVEHNGQPDTAWETRERERECINMRVSMHACACARVCVCVCVRATLYGLCEGLEGKRSRLLSLRTCQSSEKRNQKESKS